MIEVNVNLGKGREARLQLYEGQNVELELQRFAEENRTLKARDW